MVQIRLKSANFFVSANNHEFQFEIMAGERGIGRIDVLAADSGEGMTQALHRAEENLVAILTQVLESAQQQLAMTPSA